MWKVLSWIFPVFFTNNIQFCLRHARVSLELSDGLQARRLQIERVDTLCWQELHTISLRIDRLKSAKTISNFVGLIIVTQDIQAFFLLSSHDSKFSLNWKKKEIENKKKLAKSQEIRARMPAMILSRLLIPFIQLISNAKTSTYIHKNTKSSLKLLSACYHTFAIKDFSFPDLNKKWIKIQFSGFWSSRSL